MKKLIIAVVVLLIAGIGYGQDKKIAIVTFYVDKYFNAEKIDDAARAATIELTAKDDPRFNLRPILERFHGTFLKEYVKEFPFEILSEEDVINHPNYQSYSGLDGVEGEDVDANLIETLKDRFIAIDGYKVLLSGGNLLRSWRTEAHMLEALEDLEIDGVMFVSMYFQWEPKIAVGGMGNAGVRAYISIDLFNKEAKKVFKMNEFATSKKGVALLNGVPVMNYDKLLPMCEDASDRLMEDLEKKLPKLVKKVDKNL